MELNYFHIPKVRCCCS